MRSAYLMFDFSFSLSISSLTKVLARCQRDLTTPLLCFSGWLLRKLRYWSVWVLSLYTLVLMHPSFCTMIMESKKPNDLSLLSSVVWFFVVVATVKETTSRSVVHLIWSSMELRCSVKSSAIQNNKHVVDVSIPPAWSVGGFSY